MRVIALAVCLAACASSPNHTAVYQATRAAHARYYGPAPALRMPAVHVVPWETIQAHDRCMQAPDGYQMQGCYRRDTREIWISDAHYTCEVLAHEFAHALAHATFGELSKGLSHVAIEPVLRRVDCELD